MTINKNPFMSKKMLVDWFGDRGEEVKKSWIRNWFVKEDYLYIQWNDKAPYHLKPEEPYDCNSVNWKNLYFEFNDEVMFNEMKNGA